MYNVAREKFLKSGYLYSKKEDSECFEPSFWTFSCQSYVSDLASGITGEVIYVDAGYNIMGM